MTPDHLVKVFDILDVGFRDWTFSAAGLIFVAFGIGLVFFPKIPRAVNIPSLEFESGMGRFAACAFLVFSVLWTTGVFWTTYSHYVRFSALARDNQCHLVEGQVQNFVPMPFTGHASESFSVAGVPFKYSDFESTGGFNNTSSHGGPIDANSYVRICYDPQTNVILRLEIRDFQGEVKDYSSWRELFPNFRKVTGNDPDVAIKEYGILSTLLYVLDLMAILNLVLPYYRTFIRIGTSSGWTRAMPIALEPKRTVKLSNTMLYWDRPNQAIWLRPRGFNLFQARSTVARLNLDASERTITGSEIRFSSGAILIFALFLLAAYLFFSSAKIDAGSPAVILILFGAFAIFADFMNVRLLRSRMEKLVDEAVSELGEM